MNKRIIIAAILASALGTTAQAQTVWDTNTKWDNAVERLFHFNRKANASVKSVKSEEPKGFIVSCTDGYVVAEAVKAAGYDATVISPEVLSVSVPLSYISILADMKEVKYINGARKLQPTMTSTRKVTGVDKLHNGEGLETPFTGKGVIVGIIDQGFQYQHLAFLDKDDNPRVRMVWDHYHNNNPVDKIPTTGDMIAGVGGHGTHVTNIAAGSPVKGNNYYGIAHNAEIIMVPSKFEDVDVLKEAKFISDFAKKEGKPFVINMSFGSQIGPHDGSGSYCQGMDNISEDGGILVAAMGNEGELKLHCSHEFTKANETIYVVLSPGMDKWNILDLWAEKGSNSTGLKVRPLLHVKTSGRLDFKNDNFWKENGYFGKETDPFNGKEHYLCEVNSAKFRYTDYFGLEITGNPGDKFHAWVNPQFGEIYTPTKTDGNTFLRGNNEYCVGEGAATIPSAIAVASYNGNNGNFISASDGKEYSYAGIIGAEGSISKFSSRGPGLGDTPKPTVAAPGGAVISAVSSYGSDFNPGALEVSSIIAKDEKKYYYSIMSGTSMASPSVTGIVALWLEANPQLTYQQVKQIIMETSKLDNHTGTKYAWDAKRGYGKIDAYEGLKRALELAEVTGINDQLNSETPVSIKKEAQQFRILFNNDESYAHISLYNANGVEVQRQQMNDIHRGEETLLSTDGLASGVYIIRINTTKSTIAKKMLVK